MDILSVCGFVLLSVLFSNQLIAPTSVDASRQITQSSLSSTSSDSQSIYIVFTSKNPTNDPNGTIAYNTNILYRALGSTKAAENALVYSYSEISGFEAKLTDKQVSLVEEQPEVIEVLKSEKDNLYNGKGPGYGPGI